MLKHLTEARKLIHKSQVEKKVVMKVEVLMDILNILKGVIKMAYPAYHELDDF